MGYYRRWIRIAFHDTTVFVLSASTLLPIVDRGARLLGFGLQIDEFVVWGPFLLFCFFAGLRLVAAPYWMHQADQKELEKVRQGLESIRSTALKALRSEIADNIDRIGDSSHVTMRPLSASWSKHKVELASVLEPKVYLEAKLMYHSITQLGQEWELHISAD